LEHRLGARRYVRTTIVVHTRGLPSVIACTREVSVSGMFIETDANLFAENRIIEVELPANGRETRTERWRAMVVRRTSDGIGVTFDRLRLPIVRLLLDAPDAGQAAPASGTAPEPASATC
jgi:hypothetical protein